MALTYFPFDAGAGANVTEDQWRKMARHWRETGVLGNEDGEFEVTAQSPAAMAVDVAAGKAWIRGHYVESDAVEQVTIAASDPTNDRIDRIVLRVDFGANLIEVDVLEGTPAASPSAPALTQSTSTWEISLAQVLVNNGVGTIIAANITDERTLSYSIAEIEAAAYAADIVPAVTALPSSPADGDEVDFIAEGTASAPTLIWRLRYLAEVDDAYKWMVVGGRGLYSSGGGDGGLDSTVENIGPAITLPLAGIYDVEGGYYASGAYLNGQAFFAGYGVDGGGYVVQVVEGMSIASGTPTTYGTPTFEHRDSARAAGSVYRLIGQTSVTVASVGHRWLKASPVRVG